MNFSYRTARSIENDISFRRWNQSFFFTSNQTLMLFSTQLVESNPIMVRIENVDEDHPSSFRSQTHFFILKFSFNSVYCPFTIEPISLDNHAKQNKTTFSLGRKSPTNRKGNTVTALFLSLLYAALFSVDLSFGNEPNDEGCRSTRLL